MARLPNRSALEAMKRVDIQKLCKDYGVKANLKTEALIDLLLDASKPPAPTPQRNVSTRRISTRSTGSRPRGRSGASVIIHDTDDEQEGENEEQEVIPVSPPPPRARKAKELQKRLGVGRPVAAGGSGPRAITKSVSMSKGKRGKGSRDVKATEPTIEEEEPEEELVAEEEPAPVVEGVATTDAPTNHDAQGEQPNPETTHDGPLASLEQIDKHVARALRPIHEQMQSLRSELVRLKAQVADTDALKLKVVKLATEVESLRTQATASSLEKEMQQLKKTVAAQTQKQIQPASSPARNLRSASKSALSETRSVVTAAESSANGLPHNASTSTFIPPHPGFAPIMLGKRHRDSTASNVTGVIDEGEEDEYSETELAKRVIRPTKKRPKIGSSASDSQGDMEEPSSELGEDEEQPQLGPRIPSFTVYSGPASPHLHQEPPPPTMHLPSYFAPPSPPGAGQRPTTATANAAENQNAFNFAFLPLSGGGNGYMASYPYPEPPQSPSPVGNTNELFSGFGMPARPRSGAASGSGTEGGFVNPAMLSRTTSDRDREEKREREHGPTSHEVAAGLGLTVVRTSASTPPGIQTHPPVKRTMYGTELDGDSRFGDFGVEGVASGFWAGGRF